MLQFDVSHDLHSAVQEAEYRQLVNDSVDATLFNDWHWLATWLSHTDAGQHLFITGRTDGGTLIAFLGLRLDRKKIYGIPAIVATFAQYPWADRIGQLLHPDYPDAWKRMLDFINVSVAHHWDVMIWEQWSDTSGLREQLQNWSLENETTLHSVKTCDCPEFLIGGVSAEEIVATYPSKMRTDLKRRRKKLTALKATLTHVRPDRQQLSELLPQLKTVEQDSWKGDEGLGIFNHPEGEAFFRSLAERLAEAGHLDLVLVYIDGVLASYKFGFYYRNRFLDYSIAYRQEYGKLALGRILLDEIVLEGARLGYDAVDASRVGARTRHLLLERTDRTIPHWRQYWFNPSLRGRLLALVIIKVKPAARNMRAAWRQRRASAAE